MDITQSKLFWPLSLKGYAALGIEFFPLREDFFFLFFFKNGFGVQKSKTESHKIYFPC